MRLILASVTSLLLVTLLHIIVTSSVSPTDCPDAATTKKNVMITSVFVDTYGLDYTMSTVLATSDGGAVFASRRLSNRSPRVVKVDSEGRFEWYSEQRVSAGDSTSVRYYPYVAVEDPDGASVYVAGYSLSSIIYTGFIIKYRMMDGICLGSSSILLEVSTVVYSLLLDSADDLIFGGYCYAFDGGFYAIAGIIDKSTLAVTSRTVVSPLLEGFYIYQLVEDPAGYYVYAARSILDTNLRIGRLSKSTWTQTWSFHTTVHCYAVGTLTTISSGSTYSVLCDDIYYVVTSPAYISAGVTLTGSCAMANLQEAGMAMALGIDTNGYSFAYEFNVATNCVYTQGETAKHYPFKFLAASRHPSHNYVWAAGISIMGDSYGFVAKIQQVTPLPCTGAQFSYLNKGCYDTTAASCYYLCSSCMIPNDINACYMPKSTANQYLSQMYVGRCLTSGKHYDSTVGTCQPILQSSDCHKLCGGECLVVSDNTRCAHHCTSHELEPHLDDSLLYQNTCGCKLGTVYSSASGKCEAIAGCHASCGSGGCVAPGDYAKCVDCAVGATTNYIAGAEYVLCCARNTIYFGGVCSPCYGLCDGCSLPGDGTACLDCKSGPNIAKTAGSPDFTCACSAATTYDPDSMLCVYQSGCHPLCAATCTVRGEKAACVSACVSTAQSIPTAVSGVISCACGMGAVFNGTACVPTFQSGCYPLCGVSGCISLNDPAKCLDCSVQLNVVSSSSGTGSIITRNCGCAAGTHFVPEKSICACDSACSPHCGLCYSPGNASACVGCARGIDPVFGLDQTLVTCECPAGTIYHGERCVPVMNETCHPLCGPAGCIESGNQTMCVSSCSGGAASTAESGDLVSCVCANGTRLNSAVGCVLDVACDPLCANCRDRDTCSACPQEGEGMVLSDGKCICAVSKGYIMVQDQGTYSCMQKTTTASTVAQYTGYVYPRLSHRAE